VPAFIAIGKAEEFARGQIRPFEVNGHSLCVARVGERFFAFSRLCTHEYVDLSYGYVMEGQVFCGQHDAGFDLETGAVTQGPAAFDLRVYAVKVEDGQVLVSTERD
jgi:3-phenylpropionate/trans-cinnamate dioxygenase ferredoxin subunit